MFDRQAHTLQASAPQIRGLLRPRMIIAAASAHSRRIGLTRYASVARELGAYFMVDTAHYAGLIAAGVYPNPVPFANFLTSTLERSTHV